MPDFWSWNNAIDAPGTLLSSTVGSAIPTANLLDPRVGRIWRAGATSATLNVQLPVTAAISLIGIFGHNRAGLGPITLSLGSMAGTSDLWTVTFDPSIYGRQAVFVLRDEDGALAPVSAAFASVSVAGGAPMEIGRIWLGTADWASAYGHSPDGSSWKGEDLSRRSRTSRSGAFLIDRGARRRSFTANYELLGEGEYAGTLLEMDERGLAQQMLFVPDPGVYDPHRFSVLGYLDDLPATNWRTLMTAGRAITITEAG